MQNLSPLRKLNFMFSKLEENKINVVYYDKENKFFSVEKQGLNGLITVNNFIDDLESFLISVELFMDQLAEVEVIKKDKTNSISINETKEFSKIGFDLSNYFIKVRYTIFKINL